MVQDTEVIRRKTKFFNYVTECKNCSMQYVGQTKNKFSVRWTAHRLNWNKLNLKKNHDRAALLKHYASCHEKTFVKKPCISDCFRVIFVEQPNKKISTGVKTIDFVNWIPKLI